MSILIKGIDLPKTKDNRWIIQIYNNGEIHIAEEIWDDTKKGHDKLRRRYIGKGEAIQIDRPHGRLIDASTETTVKSMSGKAMDVGMLLIALKQFVPTILEAEE